MRALIASTLAVTGTSAALAQQAEERALEAPLLLDDRREADFTGPWSVAVSFDPTIRFSADFDAGTGDYSVAAYPLTATIGYQHSPKLRFDFSVDAEIADYDISSSLLFPGDTNPFDTVYTVDFTLAATYLFDNDWALRVAGFFGSSWEEDANFGDGVTGGGLFNFSYRFSEDLILGGGLGVRSRLEDEPFVFPAIFIRWNINDRFTLETEGLGITGSYHLTPEIDLFVSGDFQGREFVLRDDGPFPEAVVRDQAFLVGGGIEFRPDDIPGLTLSLEAGAVVFQEFESISNTESRIEEIETDMAPYIGAFLRYRF